MADEKSGDLTRKEQKKMRTMNPLEEMERLVDNVLSRNWLSGRWSPFESYFGSEYSRALPKVDLIDRDTDVVVRAEVPGVKKEDIEVSVTDDSVTLRGAYAHKEETKEEEYYRSEMTRGSFSRTVSLPANVDSTRAEAKLDNGILELTIPKVEKATRRTIEITES